MANIKRITGGRHPVSELQGEIVLDDLARLIADGYAQGRMHFGDLDLDVRSYASRIQTIITRNLGGNPSNRAIVRFARALHYRDLYLAVSCAKDGIGFGHRTSRSEHCSLAWRVLTTTYQGFIDDLARALSYRDCIAEDIASGIVAELFLPDRSGRSRIMSYDGRSSLHTWLRAVICHRVMNLRLSTQHTKTVNLPFDLPDGRAGESISRAFHANRYGLHLAEAIGEACIQLSEPERLLLLWRYSDRLGLGQIAGLLGIHQSNVTRRLDRLHRKLQDRIVLSLSLKHGMNQGTILECFEDVLSNSFYGISILDSIAAGLKEKHALREVWCS